MTPKCWGVTPRWSRSAGRTAPACCGGTGPCSPCRCGRWRNCVGGSPARRSAWGTHSATSASARSGPAARGQYKHAENRLQCESVKHNSLLLQSECNVLRRNSAPKQMQHFWIMRVHRQHLPTDQGSVQRVTLTVQQECVQMITYSSVILCINDHLLFSNTAYKWSVISYSYCSTILHTNNYNSKELELVLLVSLKHLKSSMLCMILNSMFTQLRNCKAMRVYLLAWNSLGT